MWERGEEGVGMESIGAGDGARQGGQIWHKVANTL